MLPWGPTASHCESGRSSAGCLTVRAWECSQLQTNAGSSSVPAPTEQLGVAIHEHTSLQVKSVCHHSLLGQVTAWHWTVMCLPCSAEYTLCSLSFCSLFQFWKICLKVWTTEGHSQLREWRMVSEARDTLPSCKGFVCYGGGWRLWLHHCLVCAFPDNGW